MSLSESAASGDRLRTLRDLRDMLAVQIDGCDSNRDFVALSGRFQSVLAEISDLAKNSEKAGDPVDEIAARRTARGSSTARAGRAERGSS